MTDATPCLIDLIEPGQGTAEQNAFLAAVPPINLFKALAHAPAVAALTAQLGGAILYRGALDPRVRELAILRAAHVAASAYEVGHHERIGRDVGLTDADLASARPGAPPPADPHRRLALAWSEAVAREGRAPQALVREARERLGQARAVELAVTVGYYLMIAGLLTTFRVPFEGAAFDQGVDIHNPVRG